MSTAWSWDSICSVKDHIYSTGGSNNSDDSREAMVSIDVLDIEAYSPRCNQ